MSSLLEIGGLLGLAAVAGYWLEAMRSKELARAAGKRACQQAQVQFLDDTVELVRVRVRRDGRGRLGFYREYRFEFSDDGADRRRGELVLFGRQLVRVVLEPHRFAERLH
jgi:hypothetical protein